jgi:hypothetical protein
MSAATSTCAGRRLMPRYNAARHQDQNVPSSRFGGDLKSPGTPGGPRYARATRAGGDRGLGILQSTLQRFLSRNRPR